MPVDFIHQLDVSTYRRGVLHVWLPRCLVGFFPDVATVSLADFGHVLPLGHGHFPEVCLPEMPLRKTSSFEQSLPLDAGLICYW